MKCCILIITIQNLTTIKFSNLRTFIIQIHAITPLVENYLVTSKPLLFIEFDKLVIQNNVRSGI